jgi:predicted P-loop ATPase/GTPase
LLHEREDADEQVIPATRDIPSAATIADAVWDEALSGHTTAGSGGKALGDIDTHTDTEVASILAAVDTEVAAIKAKTDQLTFTTANQVDATTMSMAANALTAAATASDFGTEVATAVWASATRTLSALGFTLSASDLAADTIGASELAADAVTEIVNAVLTTAMTESYNADGAAPTLAQAMFLCMQRLTEFAISGTTVTVKKLDGSTTAYTLTLDDATSPTSSTRAT